MHYLDLDVFAFLTSARIATQLLLGAIDLQCFSHHSKLFVIVIEQVPPSLFETALVACSPDNLFFLAGLGILKPGNIVKNDAYPHSSQFVPLFEISL